MDSPSSSSMVTVAIGGMNTMGGSLDVTDTLNCSRSGSGSSSSVMGMALQTLEVSSSNVRVKEFSV